MMSKRYTNRKIMMNFFDVIEDCVINGIRYKIGRLR